jgi:glutamyl-tRNA(Gln) amidotransferase subunit E
LVREGHEDLFEAVAQEKGMAAVAARTFLSTYPELQKEGVDLEALTEDGVKEAFCALSAGRFAKEALPAVLKEMSRGANVDEAVSSLGLGTMGQGEAVRMIDAIINERADFVKERREDAVGPLMGVAMKELRGKVDGKEAADLLKERIKTFLKR